MGAGSRLECEGSTSGRREERASVGPEIRRRVREPSPRRPRSKGGDSSTALGYSTFLKTIAKKTETIKSKSGCEQVAYTIVVKGDGVVALKASAIKEKKK